MNRRMIQAGLAASCIIILVAVSFSATATSEQDSPAKQPISLVKISNDQISILFTPPEGKGGILEAELYTVDKKLLAKISRNHQGMPFEAALTAEVDEKDLADYYIRYRFDLGQAFEQRSLYYLGEILETTVLGQREFVAGTQPVIRILVADRASGKPIEGAHVSVELVHEENILSKSTTRSDNHGQAAAVLDIPDKILANVKLKVNVTSHTAKDSIEETIQIRSALKTLLTTDKPLYQPGQTIHIRALTLSLPEMNPLIDAEVVFEVEDSKGNKVFKSYQKTDSFGISHVDFVLADELNMGSYKIRAIAAGVKEEKTVTVERYVLPKFKINLSTDRNFYQPGETVQGDIQTDYFFGKPVSEGKVEIKCSKFDVAYEDFQVIEGKTDAQGHYAFEVRLPRHFVGQPLEAGNALAKFEIKVTDTADHKETVTKNISVTASPILIAAVPESGELIPNLENKVYIVTTYADSTPAQCSVTCKKPDESTVKIETDDSGFGELVIIPSQATPVSIVFDARDKKGQTGQAAIELKAKDPKEDDTILVRTDKSLYQVGDKLKLSVFSTKKSGAVYVDFIKDRQTYLTRTLDLKDGKAQEELVWDVSLAGTVQVNAYLIGKNGIIVRDKRLALVDPADDLNIKISSDAETYLPASEAKLTLNVTNKQGKGVASALGVIVVDEAVFALQEMQPGLEKIYFYLEKEIATPRYEIHGYELDQCISTPIIQDGKPAQTRRDAAARVLLASAGGVGDYPLHINTYQKDKKAEAFQTKMINLLAPQYGKVTQALEKYSKKHRNDKENPEAIDLKVLIQEKFLKEADSLDPWGNLMKISGTWCQSCHRYHNFVLFSAGIDGKWGTADDITTLQQPPSPWGGPMNGLIRRAKGVLEEDVMLQVVPMAAEMDKAAAKDDLSLGFSASTASAGQGPNPIRIRQYFPETLYFNPSIITDEKGNAIVDIPLADSITTWRLTCMASSARGQLGSATEGIRVFQDFFVDIDFPVSLTQNDQIHVPVAIYNYLKTDQTIKLQVQKEDWFEFQEMAEKTVTLAPSEVRAVYFPITARKTGFQKFTVTAYGTKRSDAVARTVEIVPDGKETLISESGRLEGKVEHTLTIPDQALDDASKIFVKIYPGVLSQVVEGLDKMLQMPFGCFEQTSSVTYPNILILDYMKSTKKITPQLQMKAEGFINAGYQRLVSYEVPGGGFEWFGKEPAHRVLTAYGLMEFFDMSKVSEVDPAIITRTQQWLAKCQEKDGSYKPAQGGIQEGAINKFTDDVLRNTAYITWALAASGYQGPEVNKGIQYIQNHLDDMKDVYTRALAANALATIDSEDKTTLEVLRTLHDMRKEKEDMVYWQAESETPTHGTGNAADIEVTALAVQAFIRCGQELGTVSKAITYLVKNKDSYGTWQSTQATIQALRAMLMAERGATAKTHATISVAIDDKQVTEIKMDEKNSDVLQLVDLKDYTQKGQNDMSISFEGKGSLLYQIVGRYYLPYAKEAIPSEEKLMSIDIRYDRTELSAEDIIHVTARVSNNRPGRAKMVMVDLGLPPGFTLMPEKLNQLVEKETIEKYSVTGRQIMVYLREVEYEKPVEIHYQLLAKYPLKAKTPKSSVYEYYNPDIRAETQPVQLTVLKTNAR